MTEISMKVRWFNHIGVLLLMSLDKNSKFKSTIQIATSLDQNYLVEHGTNSTSSEPNMADLHILCINGTSAIVE